MLKAKSAEFQICVKTVNAAAVKNRSYALKIMQKGI